MTKVWRPLAHIILETTEYILFFLIIKGKETVIYTAEYLHGVL